MISLSRNAAQCISRFVTPPHDLNHFSLQLDVHLGLATDITAVLGDIETEDEDSMIDEV